jgi:hypothetical protein
MCPSLVADGIAHELVMTVRAQVVAMPLIDIFACVIDIFLIEPFEDLVKFQQMVAFVIRFFTVDGIDHRLDF